MLRGAISFASPHSRSNWFLGQNWGDQRYKGPHVIRWLVRGGISRLANVILPDPLKLSEGPC